MAANALTFYGCGADFVVANQRRDRLPLTKHEFTPGPLLAFHSWLKQRNKV